MRQLTGKALLDNPQQTKSTAFTRDEREKYKLRGLLPYTVSDLETQKKRVLENLRRQVSPIEKYIFLNALKDRNQRLFYRTLIDHIDEIMPLVYTPTVGEACKEFANIFRKPQGFYVTPEDRGEIRRMLDNWPDNDIRIIVITDGERILGLGDLGANGMGIPIGKLSLYVACAGVHPSQCLPVMLDVGTNNNDLRSDPLYLGYPHPRVTGRTYYDLIDEFVYAIQDKYPKAVIQFEDFLTPNAYTLLDRFRRHVCCFNDDIQGTAAVTLAGIYASTRISGKHFSDLTIMFLGAGSAATGIADLMVSAFRNEGLDDAEARRRIWFVDINGLLVSSRNDLMNHNVPYAHDSRSMNFVDAIEHVRPDILIGATGAPGTFTSQVIGTMAALQDRPAIFALSNPTSRAECTAEEAYTASDGRAIFASGSPSGPVFREGQIFQPGQSNNAYVFPGIGLGAVVSGSKLITETMFLDAARILADEVSESHIAVGSVYPPLTEIRRISVRIATGVAKNAVAEGLTTIDVGTDIEATIEQLMYDPVY